MNKCDKETLLDLYMSIKDLIEEAESILKMEAPNDVYDRAKFGWISDFKRGLGTLDDNNNTFVPSFLTTLRELKLVDQTNSLVDSFEDDDDDLIDLDLDKEEDGSDRVQMKKEEKSNDKPNDDEEDDDSDGAAEWQDETIFAMDTNEVSSGCSKFPNHELVKGEPIVTSPGFRLVPRNVHNTQPLPGFVSDDKPSINDTIEKPVRFLEPTGLERWMVGRVPHRVGGPAIIFTNGAKYWYHYGKLHRDDGPAIEDSNGSKSWFIYGQKHRDNGPAEEKANGDKSWFKRGLPHREDGPSLIKADGYKEWAFRGILYSTEQDWQTAKESCRKKQEVTDTKQEIPLIYGGYASRN